MLGESAPFLLYVALWVFLLETYVDPIDLANNKPKKPTAP